MKQESIQRGKILQQLREASGMTQEELADHMGLASSDITLMETGIKFPEDEETIEKLAFYLNVTKKELLTGNYDTNSVIKVEEKETKSILTNEHKKNILLIVLSCIVLFIIVISLASIRGEDPKNTYYLYFNNDNIIDNESTLVKTNKKYVLSLNTLQTINNKEIKSVSLYYKDNNDSDVIISGLNKDYNVTEDKTKEYNLKEMINNKTYLDIIYTDDTKDTTKIDVSTDYRYVVSDEREPVEHTVKVSKEKIIYNTQAMSANNSSHYDGEPLLQYGFTKENDYYIKRNKNYSIRYEDSIFYMTIFRTGGNMCVERDARQSLIKYTDYNKSKAVTVEMNTPNGKLNCDNDICTSNSDYYKYLNLLVDEVRR